LHPGAASININKSILKMYFKDLLPSLATPGDDGNYAETAAADLSLMQVIYALMFFRSMFMNEFM